MKYSEIWEHFFSIPRERCIFDLRTFDGRKTYDLVFCSSFSRRRQDPVREDWQQCDNAVWLSGQWCLSHVEGEWDRCEGQAEGGRPTTYPHGSGHEQQWLVQLFPESRRPTAWPDHTPSRTWVPLRFSFFPLLPCVSQSLSSFRFIFCTSWSFSHSSPLLPESLTRCDVYWKLYFP